MAGYNNIRNSTANADSQYFTAAGVAINASNQPNIDDSVMAGVLDSSLGRDMYGLVSETEYRGYTGHDRNTVTMGISQVLKGSVSNALRNTSAVPPNRESIHQMDALRTERVTTAIRAGLWHDTSGVFTTAPAVANDFAAVGNDNEADSSKSAPGKFTFNQVGGVPTNSGYSARTQ